MVKLNSAKNHFLIWRWVTLVNPQDQTDRVIKIKFSAIISMVLDNKNHIIDNVPKIIFSDRSNFKTDKSRFNLKLKIIFGK